MYRIIITAAESHSPAGKLADAEIHFTDAAGALAGLKLIGFSIWERRTANARRSVTMPARTYQVNGERRSFALLRPLATTATTTNMHALCDAILAEFERQETEDDDNADRMRGAIDHDAERAYQVDQDRRRQLADRLATMTEDDAARAWRAANTPTLARLEF